MANLRNPIETWWSRPPAGKKTRVLPLRGDQRMANLRNRIETWWSRPPVGNEANPPAPGITWLGLAQNLLKSLIHDVTDGGLDLHAMSLVYTTLLALAPLLAVSFSVLTAFGAHNEMRPFLLQVLEPLGEQSAIIADRIIGFVNNLDVGVLGFTGFALLFWTVLSLVQKIEDSFNRIWLVTRRRSLRRRFSDYLSVLLVGPVLVFSALGIMASMANHRIVQELVSLEPFGTLYYLLGLILPTVIMIAALTFLYLFVPNTPVRFKAALGGGLAAGLAWRLVGWMFGRFVAGSTQYAAIYSSFAILIVFIIWLYVTWLILLLGGRIAFLVQHPRYLRGDRYDLRLDYGRTEALGLRIMLLIAERFHRGENPWSIKELADRLDLPEHVADKLLSTLRDHHLVLALEPDRRVYLLARDSSAIGLADILHALRSGADDRLPLQHAAPSEPAVDRLLSRLRKCEASVLEGRVLKDLVDESAGSSSEIHG